MFVLMMFFHILQLPIHVVQLCLMLLALLTYSFGMFKILLRQCTFCQFARSIRFCYGLVSLLICLLKSCIASFDLPVGKGSS